MPENRWTIKRAERDAYDGVIPLGVFMIMENVLANAAMAYTYPSLVEMIFMTSPAMSLLASMLFLGNEFSQTAKLAAIPITAGGVIAAYGELNLSLIGAVLSYG